jgi:hypothetical protein
MIISQGVMAYDEQMYLSIGMQGKLTLCRVVNVLDDILTCECVLLLLT